MPRDTTARRALGQVMGARDTLECHDPGADSGYTRAHHAALDRLREAEMHVRRMIELEPTRRAGTLRVLDDAPVPLYDRR